MAGEGDKVRETITKEGGAVGLERPTAEPTGGTREGAQAPQPSGPAAASTAAATGAAPSAPPLAHGTGVGRSSQQFQSIPQWLDTLADIISYAIVFYGAVAGVHALNIKFGWLVTAAMLALTYLFRGFIIDPVKNVIKSIIISIFLVIIEVIEFVYQWIKTTIEYFQGDFVRMILRTVILAAFMWVFALARTIPVIADIMDFITNGIAAVVKFINQVFDQARAWVEDLRVRVREGVQSVLDQLPDWAKGIKDDLLQIVDSLFGRLEQGLARARFEILGQVDLITRALSVQLTVFGVRIGALPEGIRAYLREFQRARPHETIAQSAEVLALAGRGIVTVDVKSGLPWRIQDELRADLRGLRVGVIAGGASAALDVRSDLQALHTGAAPDVPDLPPELLELPTSPNEPAPTPPVTGRPAWMPQADWEVVTQTCLDVTSRYLAAAIGWHETNWGRVGAGRDGYTLGVGVTDRGEDPQFQGLPSQLGWACPRLVQAFGDGVVTEARVIAFGRDVYQVPDPVSWGHDVYGIYVSIATPPLGVPA